MTTFWRTSTLSAVVAGIAALPVQAEMKYDNNSGGFVSIYGQFNPAFQMVDDGVGSTSNLVDNSHSNTRVGIWVNQPLGSGTFTFNFETALGLRASDSVSQTFTPKGVDWSRTNLRKIDFAYDSGTYGKFYLGQGSMATDGIADTDYSGTSLVLYNGIGDTAGSFTFRSSAGAMSSVSISSVTSSFDGGRRGRVRYDSADFSGFSISLAAGEEILDSNSNDKFYDVALRYANEFSGGKFTGGFGFSRRDRNGVDRDDTFGSFSVLLDSGFNVSMAVGSRDTGEDYVYGKLGYKGDWFAIGQTALGVDLYDGSNFNTSGSSTRVFGIGAVQNIDSVNMEAYLGLRSYEFSEVTTSYRDIESVLFGARWKF
ncbi:porin [Parasedimentitalea maritima]|uniref:Porin n=1 Tax=Parasedimentitalea maritima TaxID=2578117 RepID=A0A6A4REU4_9RHOB|nr:porin [Zongyanglinia marina]KAE9631600.1 porin [Zongyanglinia marina]